MTGKSAPFGYNTSAVRPAPVLLGIEGDYYDDTGRRVPEGNVTPVQVVAPGQVAIRTKVAALAAKLLAQHGHYVADDLRAALAATEPAPDSGQGDMCHYCGNHDGNEVWCDCIGAQNARGFNRTPAASGGGTEADGDQGASYAGPDRVHKDTPAAEPQRVTLPEPTPPIVWTAADDEAWRPERITFNDAEYVRAQPPKADAAETDAPHGPTLAAVARALRMSGKYGYGVGVVAAEVSDAFHDAADAIEREAGGDGHE